MATPRPLIYLTASEILEFNREIPHRAGQSSMLMRDRGLLESAVLRPQNAAYYEGADLITQAALTCYPLACHITVRPQCL